jgi:hypothetical protein
VKTTKNSVRVIAITAGLICFLVYLRALSCGFINWEDQDYVLNNAIIRKFDVEMFVNAFTTMPVSGFWLPLTYISFALDYYFWGGNPFGYHLTNIILHAISTGLIVLLADQLYRSRFTTGASSLKERYQYYGMIFLAAILFGIHPARVESVVWVTERKDVLNGVFLLGAIIYYVRYQQQKVQGGHHRINREYIISLMLFLFSLWAKPSTVVLPAMLLVLDWYPLGRLRKDTFLKVLLEKVPYLLLSLFIILVTIVLTMKFDVFLPFSNFPIDQRIIASGNSLFEYFKLMLYPVGISPHYALPKVLPFSYIVKGVVSIIFLYCCYYWREKAPWFSASVFLFVIPLLPILQLFANGTVQIIILSRYTYIPSMLPSIIVSFFIVTSYQNVIDRWQGISRVLLILATGSMFVFYGLLTQQLIGVWKDSGTMWSRVIALYPFDKAYFYRGLFYVDSAKNYTAAVADYSRSLEIAEQENSQEIYNIYAFRGEAYAKMGRNGEAVDDFDRAIALYPHRLFYYHRGMALKELGRFREAENDLVRAGQVMGPMYWFPFNFPL